VLERCTVTGGRVEVTRPDASNYALWTFRTGAITRGSCQIAVFVQVLLFCSR
jgi:hypothetical protein